ncbi:MAG: mucoidy inhibitor MuiA family protein [Kiloniellaceae bacterium]
MNRRILVLCLSVAAFLQPDAGHAATEAHGESAIVAVTVFPDRAEITRTVEVSLPAGESTVVVDGLPASLNTDSVRVRGDGAFLIGSVETKKRFTEGVVRDEERALQHELEALRDRRRALDDRIAAAKIQLNFITAIGRDAPRTANREIVEGRLHPESWHQAIALLGESAAAAYERIRKAEIDKRAIERKIGQTEHRLGQVRTGRKATVSARINVETSAPATARLHLSYQLPDAAWRPLYEARLESETGRTGLVQIGEVRQGTGEDWSGVRLTLSTARPAQEARLPELSPWFIDFAQLGPYSERGKAMSELRDSLSLSYAKQALRRGLSADELSAPGAQPAEPLTAQVIAGEFAAEYRIPGAADVPSDKEPHKFAIAERAMDAHLAVRTVPKLGPRAYLYGEITYAGAEPLLPGPVSLFRDGAFVGQGGLALLRPGEAFKLSFGVDDKVRVKYRLVTGERSREGLIDKSRRIERRYRIEIANHHGRPMEVTVLDQLPVPQDERIEVALLRESTRPSARDVEGLKGVLAWRDTFGPGEEKVIEFGYAVTYPEDEVVPGF